jgi:hypothetical protein
MYHHVSTTWDEPSPEERKRAMGFQTGTTSQTKVTRVQRNILLGRGMDLNSLTWLLVTCVLFRMYTTLALIQSTCNSGDATTWHLDKYTCLSSTFYTSLLMLGAGVPCNLTRVASDTPGGTSAFGKTII